jgi:hypothetical protein
MARLADLRSRAVLRTADELGIPHAHAVGLRELLYAAAFQQADATIGDERDVELTAGWDGERGRFVAAALAAGMIVEAKTGLFVLPDMDEVAPAWVKKRATRAAARREEGKTLSDVRAEAGKKGVAARESKRDTNGIRLHPAREQTDSLPSLPPSLPPPPPVESESLALVAEVEQGPKRRQPADDGFESFWALYPKLRREGKGSARAAWKKLPPADRAAALAAVAEFGRSWEGATEEQVKFVPFPAKWIKTERWKTEPAVWHAAAAARRAEGRPRGIAAQRLIQHDDPTPEGVLEVRASDDPEGEAPVDAAPDPIHADPDLARLLELHPRPGDTESALAAWRSLSAESRAAAVRSVETIRRVANVANPGERERILPAGRWLATGAWRRDLEDTAADVLGHRAAALLPQLAGAWGMEARP